MHVLTILSLIACVAANFDDKLFASNNPKDNYFRYVRAYSQQDYANPLLEGVQDEDAPQPHSSGNYYSKHTSRSMRFRRDEVGINSKVVTPDGLEADDKLLNIDESLKPLELDVLETDTENDTDKTETTDVPNDMVINDFIRFKRDLSENIRNREKAADEFAVDSSRLKRDPERNGKMLLNDGKVLDTNREPRGAVQEKWLKQPYPIQVDNRDRVSRFNDDNQNGEHPNAPHVHFVTQRRSELIPPLVYHSYETRNREGRSKDLTRQRDIDLERDFDPAYYTRPARHYNSQLGGGRDYATGSVRRGPEFYRNYERDSRDRDFRDRDYGRDYDRDFRDRRYYGPDRYHEEDRLIPSISKQKRVIYYATLPDIVPGDRRDRDRDRDLDRERERSFRRGYYDDRDNRVNSDDRYGQPVQAINYRFRNENPYENRDGSGAPAGDKSRYDEAATAKSGSYPTNVSSADVNVRALKKNPERRIYSEIGRRYPVGYQHENSPAAYESSHR